MRTKKEMIQDFEQGGLKVIAVCHITNNIVMDIIDIDYGIDDMVFGSIRTTGGVSYFKRKIYHELEGERSYFKHGRTKMYIDEFMRIN